MDKNNLKKADKPITEGFFVKYMDNFAAAIARGFNDERENNDKRFDQINKRFEQVDKRFEQIDKRFEQIDQRFERLEKQNAADHASLRAEMRAGFERVGTEIAEVKDRLNRLDKRTDQDDSALFSDIDKLRVKVAKLEKEVKFLKLRKS